MIRAILQSFVLIVLLLAVQLLVCDQILLFGVAVPIIFIYYIICAPLWMNRNILLLVAFAIGFCVDVWNDTPGINSLACVTLVMAQRPVFYAYMERSDLSDETTPHIRTMGFAKFAKYLFTLTCIYCLLVFGIVYFSFAAIKDIAIMAGSSALLSFVLMLGLDRINPTD